MAGPSQADGLRRLASLPAADRFSSRHIGPDASQESEMLGTLGLGHIDELVDAVVPSTIRSSTGLDLPGEVSEADVLAELRQIASQNSVWTSLIGMGYHACVTPPVIQRNLLENPAWYTAYTPYQPEISQGRLEALLNYQTVITDLTALDIANASLLDEATAAAEAMAMCQAHAKGAGNTFVIDSRCHPQTIEVVTTRAEARGIHTTVVDPFVEGALDGAFGVLVQYPASDGEVRDLAPLCADAHDRGALVAVAADLLALTLLQPPGALGADIAVGTSQRFGVPLWFGGPHAAFLATRTSLQRSMPGRIVGVSVDADGAPALRLALQAREQHIRRERATSNICTAQALLAVAAGMFAAYHGPDGLRVIAERTHRLTVLLADGIRRAGFVVQTETFFDTITVTTGDRTSEVVAAAREQHINVRVLEGAVGIALDETTTVALVAKVLSCFGLDEEPGALEARDDELTSPLDPSWLRTSSFLTHPTFSSYHSETEMLRYLRSLADKDLALDRSMIPLGSCTMKLNAAVEMAAISWPELTGIHPFAPLDQAGGYLRIASDLEAWLAQVSGYDAVSIQPNGGSQGELAGLLAIRRYHRHRGDDGRTVCLIPTSAHGTNAASATMAGFSVVAVGCDDEGNVDLDDLRAKVDAHRAQLAAIMITYPSTHGVFEESVRDICSIVHDAGGQVYIDGANLNALVGLVRFGEIGGDVSHFNLHKTFCIPHGGGGPGVGPVGARAHLAPFLPGSATVPSASPRYTGGAVSATPYGSAGVLPISWAYIRLMGPDGLTAATKGAVLAANYVARRLADAYPVLYTGRGGFVAHECILDIRPITAQCGVSAEDVAKRLVDYGFHAPTMSFPVAGTLMIEPTESENKVELDRFCDAMLAIRNEIAEVAAGAVAVEESVLRRAPHTARALADPSWSRPYSRAKAVFPAPSTVARKYWPAVGRIDNAYGDRNLFCTCPPLEELAALATAAP